jgi:histidinol-phosphate aminotransferase
VQFPKEPKLSADAANGFLKSRRILPRKMGAYGLGDCLRITIAEEPALKACAQALGDFVRQAATQ